MAGRIVAGVVALCLVSSSSSSTAAPAFLPAFIPSAWLALHGRTVNAGLCLSSPPLATPQPPSPGSLRASPLFPGSTRPGALSRSAERTSGANQAGEDGEAAAAVAQGDPPDWRSQNPGYQVLGSRGAEAAAGAKAAPAPKVLGKKKRKKGQPYFDPLTPPPGPEEFPAYEPTDFFRFELVHQSTKSRARVGRIHTPHGIIDTPGFVPVATVAAQKAVDHNVLDPMADQQLMFCNTYHLLLQPGTEIIEKLLVF
ncbi:hypothetical protein T484DRAFT_1851248 [Baffinella frigidus]|nr:hypothetical protein T484DRAFT_1851248 [Cryptophyta sp. CCMP2293]